jgi:hypothetical protein
VSETTVGLLKLEPKISLLDKSLGIKHWQKGDWYENMKRRLHSYQNTRGKHKAHAYVHVADLKVYSVH